MTVLLESKFFQPRPRQEVVVRTRLLDQLSAGLQHKLTLVLAQAGFGKTTLVAAWLNTLSHAKAAGTSAAPSPRHSVAWLSLDANDNDPVRFFDYLITALQRADATIGEQARFLLSAPQPATNLEPLVISIINNLINLSGHLILVLDDYHTISAKEVHHIVHYLINHAPDLFHLVIASRTEPPLPLTRLRLYREVLEIREHELRFTLDEAMTYLLEIMRCNISPADVAALEQRTEGWIAGLHLAALSLQSRQDTSAFITAFTGSHAYIVDYLTEEVLQRQPPDIQTFLFQTSWLARFCGSLCDAVTRRSDSQKILEYLERSHLFVIPLDNERGWYRYHHLFAEMLRRRAQALDLQHGAETYRRATQWYVDQGLLMEAVEYALAAGNREEDSENAAELIERSLPPLIGRGQFVTLLQWLNRLHPAVLRARPKLCITRARSAMRHHDLDEATKWLELTWNALAVQPIQDPQVVGEAHAIRVDIALNRGQLAETIQLGNEALASLPPDLWYPRGEILFFVAIAYYWEGHYEKAASANHQAAHYAIRAGDILTALYAWTNQARFAHTQGKLRESVAALKQTWRLASEHNAQQLPLMGSYHNNLGQVLFEWNKLDAAEEEVLLAIDLAEQAHNPRTLLRGYSLLLPIHQAKGESAKADETLQRALQLLRQYALSAQIVDECSRPIVQKWLDDGNLAAVAEWLETRALTTLPSDMAEIQSLEHEYFLVARYLALQNDWTAAAAFLAKTAASAFAGGRMTLWVAIQSYHALVLDQTGDKQGARDLLNQVLEVAEPEGFVRSFIREGKDMQTLLTTIQPELTPKLQDYATLILQAFASPLPEAQQPAIQPHDVLQKVQLSEREMEVLQLVADGLSDSQIAARLVLATGTVKRHLNNIYGKLGVHNRSHALARAHTLQLL